MLLSVSGVGKDYRRRGAGLFSGRKSTVLRDVTFGIDRGEAVALVGESGSGKSTLARLILGIEKADRGEITLSGRSVRERKVRSRHLSAVFQNYSSSINPGQTVFDAIAEPMLLAGISDNLPERVRAIMERMGLAPELAKRLPRELSGGQAQRVCLARAVATEPALMVMDEALSSLDVPTQASLLELLSGLRRQSNFACLFITHDLRSVTYFCDRVLFLQSGRIVARSHVSELADVGELYAKKLLDAAQTFQNR